MIKYNAFPVHEDGNMYVTGGRFLNPEKRQSGSFAKPDRI